MPDQVIAAIEQGQTIFNSTIIISRPPDRGRSAITSGANRLATASHGTERSGIPQPVTDVADVSNALERIRDLYRRKLDEEARLALMWGALLHDVGKPATRALNAHKSKGDRFQFFGHEVYGWQLAGEQLETVLRENCRQCGVAMEQPDDSRLWVCPQCLATRPAAPSDLRSRVEYIIRRHHDHHTLQDACVQHPHLLETPKGLLAGREYQQKDWQAWDKFMDAEMADAEYAANTPDIQLLLLHGYADVLACRGPASVRPPTEVAAIDLLLLAFYVILSGH